jgi:hypothetical protein
MRWLLILVGLVLGSCTTAPPGKRAQDLFFDRLSALCGETLDGQLVGSDAQDADMRGQPLVARVAACTEQEVQINFAVGEDRSRNWLVTRTPASLRLKHVHLHADGTEDELSGYGGETTGPGNIVRQEFPADAASRELFARLGIPQSAANVWALEAGGGAPLAYELRRPGRFFRVEFRRARRR